MPLHPAERGDGFRRSLDEARRALAQLMTPVPVYPSTGSHMWLYFLIALGGALGSVARFFLSGVVAHQFGGTFPWGTLIVNVTGSFIIGFVATLTGPDGRAFASGNTRQFLMTGILGGYTTFSSFSLQTLNLAREGEWFRAGANTIGSVVVCLVAVWIGHIAAAYLNQMKGS